jgi:hypothetical protein
MRKAPLGAWGRGPRQGRTRGAHGHFPADLDKGAIASSLDYTIIINSCQISEIERVFAFEFDGS